MTTRTRGSRTGHGVSRSTRRTAGQVDAAGVGRELAVLIGGPRDRWWYWRDDLERSLAAERYMAERQGDPHPERRPCAALAYRPTERWLPNTAEPQYGTGRVWEHMSTYGDAQMHTTTTREGVSP